MPKTEVDLTRLRAEMMDYMRHTGLPVFYGIGMPEEEEFVYWDTREFPDWRQFIDVAKESGARMLLFSSESFDEEELDQAFEKLSEGDMPSEDRLPYVRQLEALRRLVGQTSWVRVAFEHGGRWLAYELTAPWYDEFQSAMEDLDAFLPFDLEEEDEEEDSNPGFFSSRN